MYKLLHKCRLTIPKQLIHNLVTENLMFLFAINKNIQMANFVKNIQRAARQLLGVEARDTAFDSLGGGLPSYQVNHLVKSMGQEKAMRFTAVYAAIRLRSNTIASLPKSIYDLTGKGRSIAKDHPVYSLLKYKPNGYQDVFTFWNYINTCLDAWGNSYVAILRNPDANPKMLIPLHPSNVMVVVEKAKKYYKVFGTQYYDGVYSDEDMLHFFNYTIDGLKGIDPIIYNAEANATGVGSQEFGNEFFESRGNIKAVIETEQSWTKEKAKTFLDNFETSKKTGNPVLTGGAKWKTVTISPEAAQMLQTRTFAIQDICRIFMVPPHLLGELSHSTFSNIEHQDIEFVKHYVRPTAKMYEQELDRKLFFDDERGKLEIKFNLDGLLRGDLATRSEFYQKAILSGWMSRNEVRELENMNPIDGLDEMMYPGNELIVGKEPIENSSKKKPNE